MKNKKKQLLLAGHIWAALWAPQPSPGSLLDINDDITQLWHQSSSHEQCFKVLAHCPNKCQQHIGWPTLIRRVHRQKTSPDNSHHRVRRTGPRLVLAVVRRGQCASTLNVNILPSTEYNEYKGSVRLSYRCRLDLVTVCIVFIVSPQ